MQKRALFHLILHLLSITMVEKKDEYVQPILSWLHKMLFFNKKVRRLFAFGSSSFEWPSDNYDVELQDFVQVV